MTARLLAPVAAAALAAGLAVTAPTASAQPTTAERSLPRTTLTFTVADCEGCEVQLHQGISTLDADAPRMWASKVKEVSGGRVTFRPATRRTHGMSVTVRAPWEGHTGYLTTVAFRYGGKLVGDEVTLAEAVTKSRASACWEGTRKRRITLPLVVEEVEVDGVHERVPGSIAFVPVTLSWLGHMRQAWRGVLGSQDFDVCR